MRGTAARHVLSRGAGIGRRRLEARPFLEREEQCATGRQGVGYDLLMHTQDISTCMENLHILDISDTMFAHQSGHPLHRFFARTDEIYLLPLLVAKE